MTVNGVAGTNYDGQTWEVDNVPLPPGGTVTLQATAQMADGSAAQTLLEEDRQPIVFTQTFGYELDYTMFTWTSVETTGVATCHIKLEWARGAGGTHTEADSWVDFDTGWVLSSRTVTVWPADNGYLPLLPGQQVISHYDNGQLTSSYTNTVPAPTLQWMEKSTSAGKWPENFDVNWSESSDREVRLFTGSNACRQRKGLFDLTASLTRESELDPNVPDWGELYQSGGFLSSAVPPVAVPSEDITLGGLGPLGSDGHLWTVQPDGIEIVITPQVSSCRSAQALAASPNVATATEGSLPQDKKYKLAIYFGGQDVTDTDVAALVGQIITLTCGLVPSDGPTITNFQWTVPSTALSNFFVSSDSLQTNGYPVPLTEKTTNTVRFCWVDPGAKLVACKVKVVGQEFTADTTFNVKRPNATLIATINTGVEVHNNALRFQNNFLSGISFMIRDKDTAWRLGSIFKPATSYSATSMPQAPTGTDAKAPVWILLPEPKRPGFPLHRPSRTLTPTLPPLALSRPTWHSDQPKTTFLCPFGKSHGVGMAMP